MTVLPKRTYVSLLVAFLLPSSLFAQGWSDSDAALTFEEFSQGLSTRINFAAWDADGNGKLSQEELGLGTFGRYDRDMSQGLQGDEVAAAERDFGAQGLWEPEAVTDVESVDSETTADAPGDVVTPDEVVDVDRSELPNWDIDGDGTIVAQEFTDGFRDWGTFAEFDADEDGGINEDELARAIFTRLDEDGNGLIAQPEMAGLEQTMGEDGFLNG